MGYYHIATRMSDKNSGNIECWQGCRGTGTLGASTK